ncbi:TlpA family protein disulfide reductase [Streptomyces sp. NPDC058657]|uniref:TlpA family protein disulfide reductase n=1 Tax=unclassified Streptomyces TaxID=2593676 RepID=UPI00364C757B
MSCLTVAVLLLGVLGVFNLVLTFGVVRRLRERPASTARSDWDRATGLSPGARVGTFSTVDTGGRPLTDASLHEGLVVVFVSPDCPACEETLPHVVERAEEYGPGNVLAVVIRDGADPGDPGPYVDRLSPVARVVLADMGGELTTAFDIQGLPAYVGMGAAGHVADTGRILPRRPSTSGPGPTADPYPSLPRPRADIDA